MTDASAQDRLREIEQRYRYAQRAGPHTPSFRPGYIEIGVNARDLDWLITRVHELEAELAFSQQAYVDTRVKLDEAATNQRERLTEILAQVAALEADNKPVRAENEKLEGRLSRALAELEDLRPTVGTLAATLDTMVLELEHLRSENKRILIECGIEDADLRRELGEAREISEIQVREIARLRREIQGLRATATQADKLTPEEARDIIGLLDQHMYGYPAKLDRIAKADQQEAKR